MKNNVELFYHLTKLLKCKKSKEMKNKNNKFREYWVHEFSRPHAFSPKNSSNHSTQTLSRYSSIFSGMHVCFNIQYDYNYNIICQYSHSNIKICNISLNRKLFSPRPLLLIFNLLVDLWDNFTLSCFNIKKNLKSRFLILLSFSQFLVFIIFFCKLWMQY